MELIVRDFRSFAGEHRLELRPLTLLTGENSSGKSSLLAAIAAATSPTFPDLSILNSNPYSLGNYKTIANYRGGRSGLAKSFAIGFRTSITDVHVRPARRRASQSNPANVVCGYQDDNGLSRLIEITVETDSARLTWPYSQDDFEVPELEVNGTSIKVPDTGRQARGGLFPPVHPRHSLASALYYLSEFLAFQFQSYNHKTDQFVWNKNIIKYAELLDQFIITVGNISQMHLESVSIAPMRTKPRRTYDEVVDVFSPEGEHIPFALEKALEDPRSRAALMNFGQESGLFDSIAVKYLGEKGKGDPIQVRVERGGRPMNLIDVGYGVSQGIPIVAETLTRQKPTRLLLQQPEVHLHPRAQAALGSLFAAVARPQSLHFVVETHSDHLIDRIRLEIARGTIKNNDVALYYIDKPTHSSQISRIGLDEKGNIIDQPPGYREFFLQEELNLLER